VAINKQNLIMLNIASCTNHLGPEQAPQLSHTQEVSILQNTIDKLCSEKESLKNTVCDLKELLKRIGVEQQREAQRKRRSTNKLLEEISRLQTALLVTEQNATHLDSVCEYWTMFCSD